MNVPFVDLKAQHQQIKNEIMKVVEKAVSNAHFIGGENVAKFEEEFAAFCDSDYAIGVNSGTDALRFALLAAGIQPGDEVITQPNTFIATTESISQVGAKIVFVDIADATDLIDIELLQKTIEERLENGGKLKAIVPVHLYGFTAHMDAINELAEKYNLLVIEDACQAHGALYSGKDGKSHKAGSLGIAGCFSFYPGKNMGACGEGGAVVTSDSAIAEKIKMIRDHGQSKKYYHEMEGYNGRLDAIQAGILRIKLQHIKNWNDSRRANAAKYNELLSKINGVSVPTDPEWSRGVYHLYVIRVAERENVQKKLAERGIASGLHYPIPLHLQDAYKHLGYKKGDFPVTENHADTLLSLPMFPELTSEQIQFVADSLKEIIEG